MDTQYVNLIPAGCHDDIPGNEHVPIIVRTSGQQANRKGVRDAASPLHTTPVASSSVRFFFVLGTGASVLAKASQAPRGVAHMREVSPILPQMWRTVTRSSVWDTRSLIPTLIPRFRPT